MYKLNRNLMAHQTALQPARRCTAKRVLCVHTRIAQCNYGRQKSESKSWKSQISNRLLMTSGGSDYQDVLLTGAGATIWACARPTIQEPCAIIRVLLLFNDGVTRGVFRICGQGCRGLVIATCPCSVVRVPYRIVMARSMRVPSISKLST